MARKKELRFLAPDGLRRAQYERFFHIVGEIAPEIWSDFWKECWPQVRGCEEGWEPVHARRAADAWLRRVRLTGPDGAPPAWLLHNLELALTTRAISARMSCDPGETFVGIAASRVVDSEEIKHVYPPIIPMQFRFCIEPSRGLEAEKKRISQEFECWLDSAIAALAARGRGEAPGEATEAAAMRLWVERWLGRRPLAEAAAAEGMDVRRAQVLVAWVGETLGLRPPGRRGRPKKRN